MNMGDIIKQLRLQKGLTQEELGQVIGVQKSAIRKYESGLVQNMKRSSIKKLADFFEVSPSFLLGYVDPEDSFPVDMSSNLRPVYASIVAGVPMEAQTDIIDRIAIDFPNPERYFGIKVNGDSMIEAGIPNGCVAIFRSQQNADNGQIVAACLNGETTLKRFTQVGDTIFLMPANASYTPIPVKDTDDFSIYGVLVETRQKFY